MITFKPTEDLSKLPPADPAFPTVEDLVRRFITEYSPPGETYNRSTPLRYRWYFLFHASEFLYMLMF